MWKVLTLTLAAGQHIYLSARINGSPIVCPYRKKTQYLGNLPIGDTIDVRCPSGLPIYNWKGVFDIKEDKKGPSENVQVKQLSKIVGGTGITPIMQLVTAVFRDLDDDTCLIILFANQTEEDILPRNELEEVQKQHPNMKKKLHFVRKYNTFI